MAIGKPMTTRNTLRRFSSWKSWLRPLLSCIRAAGQHSRSGHEKGRVKRPFRFGRCGSWLNGHRVAQLLDGVGLELANSLCRDAVLIRELVQRHFVLCQPARFDDM